MSRFRSLIVLLSLSLLAACDNPPEPSAPPAQKQTVSAPTPAQAVPPPGEPEPAQTPKKLPALGSKAVEDTSLPKPAERQAKPAAKVASQKPLPAVELDLQLPRELVEQLQPDEPASGEIAQPALLPEMFVEKPKEPGPFELNGRLITHDREKSDNYWDSVEGAELQFKFRN